MVASHPSHWTLPATRAMPPKSAIQNDMQTGLHNCRQPLYLPHTTILPRNTVCTACIRAHATRQNCHYSGQLTMLATKYVSYTEKKRKVWACRRYTGALDVTKPDAKHTPNQIRSNVRRGGAVGNVFYGGFILLCLPSLPAVFLSKALLDMTIVCKLVMACSCSLSISAFACVFYTPVAERRQRWSCSEILKNIVQMVAWRLCSHSPVRLTVRSDVGLPSHAVCLHILCLSSIPFHNPDSSRRAIRHLW